MGAQSRFSRQGRSGATLPSTTINGTREKRSSSSLRERLFLPLVISNIVFAYTLMMMSSENDLGMTPILKAEVHEQVQTIKLADSKNNLLMVSSELPVKLPAIIKETTATTVEKKTDLAKVGFDGGAWTAQTHLTVYGFNADWGLMEVLEDACREIENAHNAANGDPIWYQYTSTDPQHVLMDYWVSPKVVDAKVVEIGCGVGIYVDALIKENAKRKRTIFGVEPNRMGGTFDRRGGPKQLAIDILEQGDTFEFGTALRKKELRAFQDNDQYFDLIYSIEVFEHMPLDRHIDAARFLAGLSKKGTKLIFGASSPQQQGTGHIGNRKKVEWETILLNVGFHKDAVATAKAQKQILEYNHKKNTQVYFFHGV
jgi:hypothetical protein